MLWCCLATLKNYAVPLKIWPKTANEFLAASWHVAASGHGAGAPISFDEASFLDYAETVSSLEYSEHPVIRLTVSV